MTLRIIGSGFGRTGTLSLKFALEMLGFSKCYHMKDVFEHPDHISAWTAAAKGETPDWGAVFEGYQASVDWPGSAVWRELLAAYPDAKIIHSERDEAAWLKSFDATIRKGVQGLVPGPPGWPEMANAIVNERVFGGRAADDDAALDAYRRNNAAVRAEVPPEKLLVFDPGAGWAPLCAFLDVPVPDTPYPHVNKKEHFGAPMTGATT